MEMPLLWLEVLVNPIVIHRPGYTSYFVSWPLMISLLTECLQRAKMNSEMKKGLQKQLKEMVHDDEPIKDIIIMVKEHMTRLNMAEHEVVVMVSRRSLLLLGLLPSSGVAAMLLNIVLSCPVHHPLAPYFPYLFYASLATWFSVFLTTLKKASINLQLNSQHCHMFCNRGSDFWMCFLDRYVLLRVSSFFNHVNCSDFYLLRFTWLLVATDMPIC